MPFFSNNFSTYSSKLADITDKLINLGGSTTSGRRGDSQASIAVPHAHHCNINDSTFNPISPGIQQRDPLYQSLHQFTATGAAYDSHERFPPSRCQPGTRQKILEEITSWVTGGREASAGGGSLMWLHGPAGAGKSAIAQTICETSAALGQLAASFFFSRGNGSRGKVDRFVPTIAFQLAMSGNNLLRDQIAHEIRKNPSVMHRAVATQIEHLIVKPLQSLSPDWDRARNISPFLIVVDGLDECDNNDHQTRLLRALLDLIRVHHTPLYILIVSRPEHHIKHIFDTENISRGKHRIMSLYGDHLARKDVLAFLREGFERIRNAERHSPIMKTVPTPWPSDSTIASIADKSEGYFIFASTVLKFINEEHFSPIERLEQVIGETLMSHEPFAELDKLYAQILSTSRNLDLLRRILGCIVARPRTYELTGSPESAVRFWLGLRQGEVMLTLRGLHSLFSVHEPLGMNGIALSLAHSSFREFLLDKERAGIFFIDPEVHRKDVTVTCWRYFSSSPDVNGFEYLESIFSYLMHSFRAHFDSIADKSQIFDGLKAANKYSWAPLVQASNGWSRCGKHLLVRTVDHVITEIKDLEPQPKDLLDTLTSLVDSIYLNHLSPQSIDDIRLIQGVGGIIATLNDTTWRANGLEEFLEVPPSPHSASIVKYLLDRDFISNHRLGFIGFMHDPDRSGDIFADKETLHSRLAVCCVKELTSSSPRLTRWNQPCFDYAKEMFLKHLSYAPSGANKVQAYLRALDLDLKFSELSRVPDRSWVSRNVQAILTYLTSLPELPVDIILPWKSFYETKLGGNLSDVYDCDIGGSKEPTGHW